MRSIRTATLLGVALAATLAFAGCGDTGTGSPAGTAALASPSGGSPSGGPAGPTAEATVIRVVDGDTIEASIGGRTYKVRYIGVDTPETVKPNTPVQWMGPEASAANKRLVEGRTVVLEKDVSETDQYGRLLRYVWLHDGPGWTMVNLRLVELGYAQVSTWPPDVRYVELFAAAQAGAREGGRGLWGASGAGRSGGAGRSRGAATPKASIAGRAAAATGCDPAYPTVCIPPAPPDLDCADVSYRGFAVLAPDPHHFDSDGNGFGCEGS